MKERIAIIGSGMAGAVLAKALKNRGYDVDVFEKARGAGGRMSTRTAEGVSFDHGAQYFTLRNVAARQWMQPLFDKGLIQHWHGPYVTLRKDGSLSPFQRADNCFVGVPGMNVIPKTLLEGLNVKYNTSVRNMDKTKDGAWQLKSDDDKDLGIYQRVLLTMPPQQAVALLPQNFAHVQTLQSLEMFPCLSLMVAPEYSIKPRWAAGKVENSDVISWLAWNHTKPGRGESPTLVAHTRRRWTEARLDIDPMTVLDELLDEAERLCGYKLRPYKYATVHRWLYARPTDQRGPGALWDASLCLGYAGDACTGGRVEGAIVSALDLISQMEL